MAMAQLTPKQARRRFRERLFVTLGLRRKPLKLFCEYCGKFVPSDMEWTCGYCDTENRRAKLYSFLYKCERCKQPPKSLICPYCGKISFLDKNDDSRHSARKINTATPETEEEVRLQKSREREERKAELEHEIVITRLNAELIELKKTMEIPKKKILHEILEENFSDHDAHIMAAHKIAKREKDENKKKYDDDPELLALADESVDNWLQRHL